MLSHPRISTVDDPGPALTTKLLTLLSDRTPLTARAAAFEYDGGMSTDHAPRPDGAHRLTALAARWREFWSGYWKSPHGC